VSHVTIRTRHGDPETVAAALRPDDTDAMRTATDGGAVVTTIERGAAAGLRSTADDYLVNLIVAADTAAAGRGCRDGPSGGERGRTDEHNRDAPERADNDRRDDNA
jgi:hypothetical protein